MMRFAFAAVMFATLFFPVSKGNAQRQKKAVLASFCQFSVSEQLMQASINFSEVYTFTLDENGKAVGIKRVSGDYLDQQEVYNCINRWEFAGFTPKSRVNVSVAWKHGVGWLEMKIISKDFSQTTLLNSGGCPDSR